MPSDLHIPSNAGLASGPSYRPQRRPARMEPGVKRLLLIAGGVSALLLAAGAGGWMVMSRRPAVVPVIEADHRPLRVKPENPGGMQVAGADEQVMGSQDVRRNGMAPAPEAPAPQALRAQLQAGRPSAPSEPGPSSAAGTTEPPAAPAPTQTLPAPAVPAPMAAAPAVTAAPAPVAASGSASVQLAAVETEQGATAEWQRLSRRMPDLLGNRRPVVQRVERDGRAVWRLRTGGFADMAEATSFCVRVRAKGSACTIASF